MIVRDISLQTPQENILFDDVLLSLAERNQAEETLRFWESPQPFIVLGRISKPEDDVNIEVACRDNIPMLRRSSGGGTVLQGKGCLNYSLIISKDRHPKMRTIRSSYEYILNTIVDSLKRLGVIAVFKPTSDIVLAESDRKFSGNAQRRAKKFILHHGTFLYNFCLSDIDRYLIMPKNTPAYRGGRSHSGFLTNIAVSQEDIKAVICDSFKIENREDVVALAEQQCLRDMIRTRNPEINTRQPFDVSACCC